VVEEFNRGVYDVVVATDEGAGDGIESDDEEEEADGENAENEDGEGGDEEDGAVEEEEESEINSSDGGEEDEEAKAETQASGVGVEDRTGTSLSATNAEAGPSKKRAASPPPLKSTKKPRKADSSSSMARGIDFTSASSVINFDLPLTPTAYLHRVGRTARAGQSGLSLSFVVPKKQWGKDRSVSLKSAVNDEKVFERIKRRIKNDGGGEIREWEWGGRKGEVEGFRYRMEDALRSVTGKRVVEAKREEVKRELLNSEKLKVCFILTSWQMIGMQRS